jgi:hypothetical protein
MGCLDSTVYSLLFRGKTVKIELSRGCHRLDDAFKGVMVRPVEKIKKKNRHLGIGEELRVDIPLPEIFRYRVII